MRGYQEEYKKGMDRAAMGELAESLGNAFALIGAGHATAKSAGTDTPFDATKGLQLSKKDWNSTMDRMLSKLKVDLQEVRDQRDFNQSRYDRDIRQAERAYESDTKGAYHQAGTREARAAAASNLNVAADNRFALAQERIAAAKEKAKDIADAGAKAAEEKRLAKLEEEQQKKQAKLAEDINLVMRLDESEIRALQKGKGKESYTKAWINVRDSVPKDKLEEALTQAHGQTNWLSASIKADPEKAISMAKQVATPTSSLGTAPATATATAVQSRAAPAQSGTVKLKDPATGKVAVKQMSPQVQALIDKGLVEVVE
jgi:hypothetical protein